MRSPTPAATSAPYERQEQRPQRKLERAAVAPAMKRAREASLVGGERGAAAVRARRDRVDGWAAGQQRLGGRGAAVVRQRPEPEIGAAQVAGVDKVGRAGGVAG